LGLHFGPIAAAYDQARPSYPDSMVRDLVAAGPRLIADVGCGTGKAGRLFLGDGRRVVGIEGDARMAEVAATHGLETEVSRFEDWDSAGRAFDLIVSGTAWHWVDPDLGARKAIEALRPGGRLAAFWNSWHHAPETWEVFAEAYGPLAKQFRRSYVLGWDPPIPAEEDVAAVALQSAGFQDAVPGRRITYDWSLDYTPREWVELAATHSDHRQLDASTLRSILERVEEGLARLGPTFRVGMRTAVLTGVRPA
jgi:SAM-dependent methyltransferase